MSRWRPESVGQVIRKELSEILRKELKDPRVGYATITGVEVTRDLRMARVYVSVLGDEVTRRTTLDALAHATPFLRREIGARIRLRHTPDLAFAYDGSIERGARINRILDSLNL